MIILSIIVIAGVLLIIFRNGFNTYAIIGAVIGLLLGSSLGIAGGGTAINGMFIFGGIGLIIGGLIKPNPKIRHQERDQVNNRLISPGNPVVRIKPKAEKRYKGDFYQMVNIKNSKGLAQLIFDHESDGERETATLLVKKVEELDYELYREVVEELKKIRYNHFIN